MSSSDSSDVLGIITTSIKLKKSSLLYLKVSFTQRRTLFLKCAFPTFLVTITPIRELILLSNTKKLKISLRVLKTDPVSFTVKNSDLLSIRSFLENLPVFNFYYKKLLSVSRCSHCLSAFSSSSFDYFTTIGCSHSFSEPMSSFSRYVTRLKCSFHFMSPTKKDQNLTYRNILFYAKMSIKIFHEF